MSSQNKEWVWDDVPDYRFTVTIIDTFLRETFDNYNTFHTEVNMLRKI